MDQFGAKAKGWDTPAKIAMTEPFVSKIKKEGIVNDGKSVVEVGCGTGLVGLAFKEDFRHLTMVDTSPGMLEVLKEKTVTMDKTKLTIVQGTISQVQGEHDVILAFMVLHHIEDIPQFIADVREKLVAGGKVVIGDLYAEDGSFHGTFAVPHNGFEPEKLMQDFRSQGFGMVELEPLTTVAHGEKTYGLFILTAVKDGK